MDAPTKELQRLLALQRESRAELEAGRPAAALALAEDALALEADNVRSLALKADALEALGRSEEALQLRAVVKQRKRESWQREVEAEIRGHHDLLGEAIRHERF